MKREACAVAGAVALALPPVAAFGAVRQTAAVAAAPRTIVVVRTVAGSEVAAGPWGEITVKLQVRKTTTITNGKRTVKIRWFAIQSPYTWHTGRSQYIMEQTLPQLRRQALRRHNAAVDMITGATQTSDAFQQSLYEAILKANQI